MLIPVLTFLSGLLGRVVPGGRPRLRAGSGAFMCDGS